MENTARTELFRTLKYFTFATSAGIIEMLMFTLLDQFTPWTYWLSYLIALVVSVLWNFTLNREFTFKSNNHIPTAMMKVAAYYAIFTPVTTVLGNHLVENLSWNAYVVTLLNLLLNGVTEYLYQRLYVFGKSIDSKGKIPRHKLDASSSISP
ncbi:GtrA family protein [Paenibacillus sp. NFR01]|uniref:GtrA family protein n=1 Tax=Paenibacillus sp. NFR01 TaxID=1566279 RepID=UPI0008C428D0|nr:GtrA family protein [Paenibacillus sp. NFR01]SEU27541.1 Putative flippase GtrA (transmembrane translocase of bactoprenol-linked glucose) [Paenibacillus sp. NFR01]